MLLRSTWFLGEPYWSVWGQRFSSNILAHMTIDTAIVGVVAGLPRWSRTWSLRRVLEAATVGAGVLLMGSTDFGGMLSQLPPLRAVSSQAPLALQLPFLLWAAVRFGIPGAGITLLSATILAVWSVVHGQGPFADMSPTTTVPALTLSLIIVSASVLFLSALVAERRQTQRALAERLVFEELLTRLSGAFVKVPSDHMDAGLRRMARAYRRVRRHQVPPFVCADRRRAVAAGAARMDPSGLRAAGGAGGGA